MKRKRPLSEFGDPEDTDDAYQSGMRRGGKNKEDDEVNKNEIGGSGEDKFKIPPNAVECKCGNGSK